MHDLRQLLPARALLLSFVAVTACSDGTGPQTDSPFTGRWAGKTWLGEAEAVFVADTVNTDTLYVFGIRPIDAGSLPEDVITLRVAFKGLGSYELAGDAVDYVVLVGGDVVSAHYTGKSPRAGTLVVESYDAPTGLMTGTVAFEAAATTEFRPYGQAAQFQGGRFQVRVRRMQRQRPNKRMQPAARHI